LIKMPQMLRWRFQVDNTGDMEALECQMENWYKWAYLLVADYTIMCVHYTIM